MFRTDLLSTIRSLNTVFTETGICHASYVDCLLARLKMKPIFVCSFWEWSRWIEGSISGLFVPVLL